MKNMASKENQEAYERIDDLLCIALNNCVLIDGYGNKPKIEDVVKDIETLQKAIDNEELYKKAFELVFNKLVMVLIKLNQVVQEDTLKQSFIIKAKKELENGK